MAKQLVDDALWQVVEPLLPPPPAHASERGRPRLSDRAALTGILFVLKSGNGGLLGQSNIPLPQGLKLIPAFTPWKAAMIIITWTAGTALVMWLGELITQRGIGNGMSILLFTSLCPSI